MNTVFIMIATTAIFFIGIQTGYNLRNDKNMKKNIPFTKEYKNDKENKEEIIRLNRIMSNLDKFNGTGEGQVDID